VAAGTRVVVGAGLRAVVAVVATDGAVVAEVVGPDAAEVGVVSVGTTVDVIGDAVVVASDVAGVAVLRVGELGLFELHPDETSAAASRAADAMRSTMTTSRLAAQRGRLDVEMKLVADHGFRAIAHDRRGHGRSSQT